MTKQDLNSILEYAKVNHLPNQPFSNVCHQWEDALASWYYDTTADDAVDAMKEF